MAGHDVIIGKISPYTYYKRHCCMAYSVVPFGITLRYVYICARQRNNAIIGIMGVWEDYMRFHMVRGAAFKRFDYRSCPRRVCVIRLILQLAGRPLIGITEIVKRMDMAALRPETVDEVVEAEEAAMVAAMEAAWAAHVTAACSSLPVAVEVVAAVASSVQWPSCGHHNGTWLR